MRTIEVESCGDCKRPFKYVLNFDPKRLVRRKFCDDCATWRKNFYRGGLDAPPRPVPGIDEITFSWDNSSVVL